MIHDYSIRKRPPEGEQTWTTDELRRDFEVVSFRAPYVVVRRRSDGCRGVMEFIHSPRVYFDFVASTDPEV